MPISVMRALPADRARDLSIIAGLSLWLLYTRLYFVIHAGHIVLPPCPFFYVTGHPCPFCGGTRSFAFMWRGDLADAVRLYPLGPLMFVASVIGVIVLAGSVLVGRTITPRLSQFQWRLVSIGTVASLGVSWILKVFVLGN